jgi:SlyX protein
MKSLEARLTDLETIISHQQKLIEDLNDVVIDLQKRIDVLPREISRLSDEIRVTRQLSAEIRRPEDEKPPHY